MLADFFTKPLQGELFRFFRNIIMGYVSITDLFSENDEIKERVGNWEKYKNGLISNIDKNSSIDNNNKQKVNFNRYVQTYDESDGSERSKANESPSTYVQPVQTNKNTACTNKSTYINANKAIKPTYANVARRALKSEQKAHNLK